MVELVGAKTDLRRVGSRWTGLCPFHDERTPSFSVNAEEKLFHCFGCQAKGDAIGFVEETEGLDFREAVELLAERYGVELERENEDPRGRGSAGAGASGCCALLDRDRRASTRPTCGSSAEAARRARVPRRPRARGGGAEGVPGGLLAERLGPGAASGAQRDGFSAAGAGGRGPGPARPRGRQPLRPLPRADHVPAGATRAGACSASARGRWARGAGRST